MNLRHALLRGCFKHVLIVAVLVAAGQPGFAEEARHEKTFRNLSVTVPKLAQAPTLDGAVDPVEWAGAGIAPRLVTFDRDDRLTDGQGRFYFGYTDDPPSPGGLGEKAHLRRTTGYGGQVLFTWPGKSNGPGTRPRRRRSSLSPTAVSGRPMTPWNSCSTASPARNPGRTGAISI